MGDFAGIHDSEYPQSRVMMSENDPVHPFQIFQHAMGFLDSSKTVFSELSEGRMYAFFPAYVLASFGLELILKCLHAMRFGPVRGHRLKELFDQLPADDRKRIEEYFNRTISTDELIKHVESAPLTKGISHDIDSVLMRCNRIFEIWRYQYENLEWSKDTKGFRGASGIDHVIMAVHRVITDEHPDWLKKYRKNSNLPIKMKNRMPPP